MRPLAPELDGGTAWLGVERPLTLAELRGRVVILHFWSYVRVGCLHALATLRAVEDAFAGAAVNVIGVHGARYEAQRPDHVRAAMAREGVRHPVVVDGERRLAERFTIATWPTLIVIRPDGHVASFRAGEPDRDALIAEVRALIDEARAAGALASDAGPRIAIEPLPPDALAFPANLAIASDGRVAISDVAHHRVLVCRQDGRVLASAGRGTPGFADGTLAESAFTRPRGLAWSGERLLVCDAGNHAVRAIELARDRVETLAGHGELGASVPRAEAPARKIALRSPWDLAPTAAHLYVAMAGANQLHVARQLDERTVTIALFAGAGDEARRDGAPGACAFAQPSALWLERTSGRLYVADSESASVRAVALPAATVETIASGAPLVSPAAIAGRVRDGKLELAIADRMAGAIAILDVESRATRVVLDGLAEPSGVAFAPDGKLWIADTNAHRIVVLDTRLESPREWTPRGPGLHGERGA